MTERVRKIGEKYYGLVGNYDTKKEAEERKDDIESRGYKARIIKIYGVFIDRRYMTGRKQTESARLRAKGKYKR